MCPCSSGPTVDSVRVADKWILINIVMMFEELYPVVLNYDFNLYLID